MTIRALSRTKSHILSCVLLLLLVAISAPADPEAENESYRAGKSALDEERWADAAAHFKQAAEEPDAPADAALFWQGYAFHQQGRSSNALAVLADLNPDRFPQSRWLDDARALEIEIRSETGAEPSPEAESEAELKLIALFGVMERNPTRALSYIEKMLKGPEPIETKEKALFILGQSDAPEARQLILQMAQGKAHPELRLAAIRMVATEADEDDGEALKLLDEIYQSNTDLEIRRQVLHGYMMAEDAERLLAVARGGDELELRQAAVHGLGAMDAVDALRQLYASEGSVEVKAQILHSFFIADDSETLIRVARTETDSELRRTAVRNLGLMDDTAFRPILKELYGENEDVEFRIAIIEAYFLQDAAEELVRIAKEESHPGLRRAAVERLARMDSPAAEELLLEILEN